jgi:hypothetical protein
VPADVFVYRDTDGQPGAAGPGPNDPSYWYDLPGTGPAEETPPVPEETRGPFEPLVSSADPPGTGRRSVADPEAADPGAGDSGAGDSGAGGPGRDDGEDTAHVQARRLEQIKDLYLTAEAIGEVNVDKHFDQLLAQQRELISEYFRQSSTAPAPEAADQAQAGPQAPEPPAGSPGGVPETARVTADQPHAW